jgi:hypothetical protein
MAAYLVTGRSTRQLDRGVPRAVAVDLRREDARPCEQRTCPRRARLDQPASEGSTCATIST